MALHTSLVGRGAIESGLLCSSRWCNGSVTLVAKLGPIQQKCKGIRKCSLQCCLLLSHDLQQRKPAAGSCSRLFVEAARSLSATKLARRRRLRAATPWKLTPSGNKLPHTVHATLPWARQVNRRTLIVGDVHGCYDELQELLAACSFEPSRDNLVLVGDIVNKGPKSREVITFALNTGAYVVRGNHDDGALHAALKPNAKLKTAWVKQLSPDQIGFLDSLPFSLKLEGRGVLVVHAGLKPGRELGGQRLRDLTLLRECRPVGSSQGKVPWASIWQGPAHVFFGHDAMRGLQLHAGATGLDTGCCYGNKLTACILPALPPDARPVGHDQDRAASSVPSEATIQPHAVESAAVTEEIFAQARRASKAKRTAQLGGKASKGTPHSRACQQCTAITLAELQGQLVSVPAKLMYCKPGKPAASPS